MRYILCFKKNNKPTVDPFYKNTVIGYYDEEVGDVVELKYASSTGGIGTYTNDNKYIMYLPQTYTVDFNKEGEEYSEDNLRTYGPGYRIASPIRTYSRTKTSSEEVISTADLLLNSEEFTDYAKVISTEFPEEGRTTVSYIAQFNSTEGVEEFRKTLDNFTNASLLTALTSRSILRLGLVGMMQEKMTDLIILGENQKGIVEDSTTITNKGHSSTLVNLTNSIEFNRKNNTMSINSRGSITTFDNLSFNFSTDSNYQDGQTITASVTCQFGNITFSFGNSELLDYLVNWYNKVSLPEAVMNLGHKHYIVPYYSDQKLGTVNASMESTPGYTTKYSCDNLPSHCKLDEDTGIITFTEPGAMPAVSIVKARSYNKLGIHPFWVQDKEITIHWLQLRKLYLNVEHFIDDSYLARQYKMLICGAHGSCITKLRLKDNGVYADYTQGYAEYSDTDEDGIYDVYDSYVSPYKHKLSDGTYGYDNYDEAGPYVWVDDLGYEKEYTFNLSFPKKNIYKLYTKEYSFPIDESELIGTSITKDDRSAYDSVFTDTYTIS